MKSVPQSRHPDLLVSGWTDFMSGFQARHPGLWIRLGNLETRVLADRLAAIRIEKPVYITGLARSGTTVLLELLSRHPQLASHRYRDFPPVTTPWFWNWFVDRAASREHTAVERAHGDGISVTPESPEAFEEVLWMMFFPELHDPEVNAALTADISNAPFENFYRDHIRKLLLVRGGARYLSKANYNLTRLRYLLKLFPDARFVIPVRDPVSHIASLMRQHERFRREHERDVRLQRHMSRSGHFEFGIDRRPINCGNTPLTREIRELWSQGQDVEGWSLYWQHVYGHVADVLVTDAAVRRATLVVRYESLCASPAQVTRSLLSHCELPEEGGDLAAVAADMIRPPPDTPPAFDPQQVAHIGAVTGPVVRRLDELA